MSTSMEEIIRQLSNENTAKTFAFNSSEAQKERDWSTGMSNTSHQRETEDLIRAGLNPVLSANSGAQSYTGASANAQADSSAVGALSSIYQTKMNNDNAVQIAKLQNKNNLKIAKIQAAASNYASNNSASASKYASDLSYDASKYGTDRSKSGTINRFVDSVLGNSKKSSASKSNGAGKLGSVVQKGFKGKQKYSLTGRIINAIRGKGK